MMPDMVRNRLKRKTGMIALHVQMPVSTMIQIRLRLKAYTIMKSKVRQTW